MVLSRNTHQLFFWREISLFGRGKNWFKKTSLMQKIQRTRKGKKKKKISVTWFVEFRLTGAIFHGARFSDSFDEAKFTRGESFRPKQGVFENKKCLFHKKCSQSNIFENCGKQNCFQKKKLFKKTVKGGKRKRFMLSNYFDD